MARFYGVEIRKGHIAGLRGFADIPQRHSLPMVHTLPRYDDLAIWLDCNTVDLHRAA